MLLPLLLTIIVVPVLWLVIALCLCAHAGDERAERAFREWKESR